MRKTGLIILTAIFLMLLGCSINSKTNNENKTDNKEVNRNIALYFRDNSMKLMKVAKTIILNPNEKLEKRIVEELIVGPGSAELHPTIPYQTKVNDVNVKNGTAFVDLSEEFITKHSGGSEAEYLTIYSIVDTLTELININKVEFLINGQKRRIFNHMELEGVFYRDESIITK